MQKRRPLLQGLVVHRKGKPRVGFGSFWHFRFGVYAPPHLLEASQSLAAENQVLRGGVAQQGGYYGGHGGRGHSGSGSRHDEILGSGSAWARERRERFSSFRFGLSSSAAAPTLSSSTAAPTFHPLPPPPLDCSSALSTPTAAGTVESRLSMPSQSGSCRSNGGILPTASPVCPLQLTARGALSIRAGGRLAVPIVRLG